MHGVKQIHRDRYARCLQSILINCVTAEKKNNLLTTVATKSFDFQYVKERITAIIRFFFREYTSTDNRLQEVIDTTPLFTKDLLIQPFFLST